MVVVVAVVMKVPLEDLRSASELVVRALLIRKKYMNMSSQQFPTVTERFLRHLSEETSDSSDSNPLELAHQAGLCCASTNYYKLTYLFSFFVYVYWIVTFAVFRIMPTLVF